MRHSIKANPFIGFEKSKPRIPPLTRVYAVGDIHGRADLLDNLLAVIDADLAAHPVKHPIQVFLGDYIDRGSDSKTVIDRLIERSRMQATVCLKGNHETFILDFLEDPDILDSWRRNGGLETLISYGVTPSGRINSEERNRISDALAHTLPAAHRSFIANLATTYICGDYFFVHAGVRPDRRLSAQQEEDLLWIRDEFLFADDNYGKVIVHGHEPVRAPDIRPNRINIDTGAYITGNLTCLVIEEDNLYFLSSHQD